MVSGEKQHDGILTGHFPSWTYIVLPTHFHIGCRQNNIMPVPCSLRDVAKGAISQYDSKVCGILNLYRCPQCCHLSLSHPITPSLTWLGYLTDWLSVTSALHSLSPSTTPQNFKLRGSISRQTRITNLNSSFPPTKLVITVSLNLSCFYHLALCTSESDRKRSYPGVWFILNQRCYWTLKQLNNRQFLDLPYIGELTCQPGHRGISSPSCPMQIAILATPKLNC